VKSRLLELQDDGAPGRVREIQELLTYSCNTARGETRAAAMPGSAMTAIELLDSRWAAIIQRWSERQR
jgi:hypothetical protein